MKLLNKRDLCKSRTWIEISKSALLNNISQIKKQLRQNEKFMAVVKANAYGHGLLEVANIIQNKVDYLAVFALEDAILLREEGYEKPLLVLSRIFPDQVDLAIKHDIEVTVSTFDILQNLKKNLKIHICLDTGMGRDGFVAADLKKLISIIKESQINICGIYAHFASADESKFDNYSKKQIEELLRWKGEFALNKIDIPLIHHCASAGVIDQKSSSEFNLARLGISLYGLWPSSELKDRKGELVNLKPALSWKAKISEIKSMPKGSSISYGCTHVLERDSKIAILPIGYFDGISRVSSGLGQMILHGIKVPQIGRVTMNLVVLDVTDVKQAKIDDIVTIIGEDGEVEVTADDWAKWSKTINYEIVTRLNSSIIRVQS